MDFDKRSDDKTNANMLILGNSGQGKSYLLKLILTNLREGGKRIICLDPELEYAELTDNLGGCFIDLMSGEYIINVLEPKTWDEGAEVDEAVEKVISEDIVKSACAMLEAKVKEEKIKSLLIKYWDLRPSDADYFIECAKLEK